MPLKDKDRELEIVQKRLLIIAPLISGECLGKDRNLVIDDICKENNVSRKTVLRYLSYYHEFQKTKDMSVFAPKGRPDITSKIPKEVVDRAIELRIERPKRSVSCIIAIMEANKFIKEGEIKRSTLQEAMSKRGYSAQRVRMLMDNSSKSTRFAKNHSNELWMGDIKYGPVLETKNGPVKTYLSIIIDDYSRHVVYAKYYDHMDASIVVDSLKHAFETCGLPQMLYFDNGVQYRNEQIDKACKILGVKVSHCKPRHAYSKGKCERILGFCDEFQEEWKMRNTNNLDDMNRKFDKWLEKRYETKKHSVTNEAPRERYAASETPLNLTEQKLLNIAFLNTSTRKVNKTGEISWKGQSYFAGKNFAGKVVNVLYETKKSDTVYISCEDSDWMLVTKTNVEPYVIGYTRKDEGKTIDNPSDFLTDLVKESDPNYEPPSPDTELVEARAIAKDDTKEKQQKIKYNGFDDEEDD